MEIQLKLVKRVGDSRYSTSNTTEAILEVYDLQPYEEAYLKSVMHVGNWQPRYWNSQEDRGKSWKQSYPPSVGPILSEDEWLVREKTAFLDHMKEFNSIFSFVRPAMREFEKFTDHRIGEYMMAVDKLEKEIQEHKEMLEATIDKLTQLICKQKGGKKK